MASLNSRKKPVGWQRDPARHSLAARGINTKVQYRVPSGGLLHPLWKHKEDPLEIGQPLFRGTSSKFVRDGILLSHGDGRIYLSEGDEDAEGYGSITVDAHGGKPLLVEVELTEELASMLKPGFEGLGEWYVESNKLPVKIKSIRKARNLGELGD